MVAVTSTMLPLDTKAPAFDLPSCTGGRVKLSDVAGAKALLIMFICNHCPFVHHVRDELVTIAHEYAPRGLKVVAINANDWNAYPDDSPEEMARDVKDYGYTFPYLYDESQQVAKSYQAACTPDLFLFDAEQKLVYRGQLDSSRPTNMILVTGKDLRNALEALLAKERPDAEQKPSMGCNIKWRPGNEPEYFNP